MFCFNTKNKRNAIGNAELPKVQLADGLEKKKKIALSVFNLVE